MSESENSPAPLQGSQTDGTPAGGWPALSAVNKHLLHQHVLIKGNRTLMSMNKPGGFDCPSCSWPDPKKPHTFEYCENGAKALAWESTRKRVTPDFFARHTVSELATWSDHALEAEGRITEPMRYDAATDKYLPVTWDEAFAEIGAELRGLSDPWKLELYTSGRTSNEAAFLYQLFGRLYGMANFPDCSNMCHETTTAALPESIGVGKGTTTLEDFENADAIFIIGQNPGTNSPRMMSELHAAARRGASIISFNPLRERALVRFAAPQDPRDMLSLHGVEISSQYHQVRIGGDMIALQGVCKAVIEADDVAQRENLPRVLDVAFIEEHTHGFEQYADYCRQLPWDIIERHSGLTRQAIEEVAAVYKRSKGVICCWGMGITQHKRGGDAMQQIINLLLLRGNIGKLGAGACPVRGHSNVQGDRTMGIYEKAGEPFLASMSKVFGFEASRKKRPCRGRDLRSPLAWRGGSAHFHGRQFLPCHSGHRCDLPDRQPPENDGAGQHQAQPQCDGTWTEGLSAAMRGAFGTRPAERCGANHYGGGLDVDGARLDRHARACVETSDFRNRHHCRYRQSDACAQPQGGLGQLRG
ncbi:hypothetical protein IBA8401_12780 [Pseudomonas syringae]